MLSVFNEIIFYSKTTYFYTRVIAYRVSFHTLSRYKTTAKHTHIRVVVKKNKRNAACERS